MKSSAALAAPFLLVVFLLLPFHYCHTETKTHKKLLSSSDVLCLFCSIFVRYYVKHPIKKERRNQPTEYANDKVWSKRTNKQREWENQQTKLLEKEFILLRGRRWREWQNEICRENIFFCCSFDKTRRKKRRALRRMDVSHNTYMAQAQIHSVPFFCHFI